MDYVKKLGKRSVIEGKRVYEGLAYDIATEHNRCYEQLVNGYVNITENANLLYTHSLELEDTLKDFYLQINFIIIGWQLSGNNHPQITLDEEDADEFDQYKDNPLQAVLNKELLLQGFMNIYSLKDLLEGPNANNWKDILWFDNMDVKSKEYWQQYMVFDYSVPECFILLKKKNGIIKDKLYYYYNNNDEPIDMGMTIDKYLDVACKVKVFEGWQYALMKEPMDDGVTLRRMKHYLPQIFPNINFDFSDFE